MQETVVPKPYRFVPPHPGTFWPWLLFKYLPYHTRKTWGVEQTEIVGLERLQASRAAGHGIMLASNHCRPCDPFVLGLIGARLRVPLFGMASWHLFAHSRVQRWILRRAGVFSILREGVDREALKCATQILVEAKRPLVIFPEGVISRGNDRLGPITDGVAFITRAAAKARAKADPPGQVVVHPVALRYTFHGDLARATEPVLEKIEKRLGLFSFPKLRLADRIRRLGQVLLAIKEVEYLGGAQPGPTGARVARLLDRVLTNLEEQYLAGRSDDAPWNRIRKLRTAILPQVMNGATPDERALHWHHLVECSFALALNFYPPGYIDGATTAERLLETVERYEEDLYDYARNHRPLFCRIDIGEAIPVGPERVRGAADPVSVQLEERLKAMLAATAHLCHVWKE
jgi:1-acyl-sn-glycerol-3-phosphate acyltransferase